MIAGAATAVAALLAAVPLRARDDTRTLAVARTKLTSPHAIDEIVAGAKSGGFTALLVQVREHGDAYFLNGVEARPAALDAQPTFDPLADIITKGHAGGLTVQAWINVNLVAGSEAPAARTHIVYRHPEWLMVPRQIAEDLLPLEADGPEYLGRVMRYARARSDEIDGLYLSPATPAAIEYTISVVRDIARRYAVDGVYLDQLRYPSDDFDYSRETLRAFGRNPAQAADAWRQFRAERLTALLTGLRAAVKTARPAATISVATDADPAVALLRHFQDRSLWVARGLLDGSTPF
jgi:uncharacterized lipoprotein YddW (UPF0748 family)